MGQSQLFVHAAVETFRAVDGVTGCRGSGFSSPSPVLLLSAMDRHHIVSQFKQRERVVIIDPAGTYYLSPLLQFSEAKDLHVQQAELATMAFLERSPKDFDNPDLL